METITCSGNTLKPGVPALRCQLLQFPVPQRYQLGEAESECPNTIQDHYHRIYFEVIDVLVAAISNRYDQQGFQTLQKLENLLINKAPMTDTTAQNVTKFYGADLHQDRLKAQLSRLHTTVTDVLVKDLESVIEYLRGLNRVEKEYYSEVMKVVTLILLTPATNALSERSFSALRRIKSLLRITSEQVHIKTA